MQWIKRNLFLVVGGVVALGLLGFAGFYLYTKIQQDQSVTGELDAATQKLETLAKRDPYPNQENITSAKDEVRRIHGFLGEVEKHFLPAPYPQELNNMAFRTYLENTVSQLRTDAQRAGVEVPTNYWFTFAAQKGSMTFTPSTLQPLASQLADIKTLCGVLFEAKVNSLVWIKRVAVDSQDTSLGSQEYLSTKASTNNWSVVMPYEIAFQGFSSQLASVMAGLLALPHCFVVTNMVVEPASVNGPSEEQNLMMNRYSIMRPDPNQIMRDRYGRGGMPSRYGPMMQPPPQPVVRPVSRGPQTVLDEKPLRFTLSLQAVKLKPKK